MRVWIAYAFASIFLSAPNLAAARAAEKSATLARDIDGIELGMTIDQVSARMTLRHVAFETYEGSANNADFVLGFTPAGRVFRIESSQSLGHFQPDALFVRELSRRLAAKYGPPTMAGLPSGPAYWSLTQHLMDAGGEKRAFTVMWANAMLQNDERGVVLAITMLDFRVLWQDQQRTNQAPSDAAANMVRF